MCSCQTEREKEREREREREEGEGGGGGGGEAMYTETVAILRKMGISRQVPIVILKSFRQIIQYLPL